MLLLALALAAPSNLVIDWNNTPDRTWIGPQWHANRLQDWRVKDGRVECTRVAAKLPMRTSHLLSANIASGGSYSARVTTGTVEMDLPGAENAWSGFLLGAGSDLIDYRLTAMVHHVPAEDGGIIALVDHEGHVALRRNDIPVGGLPLWSINTEISPDDLPLIPPAHREGAGFGDGSRREVELSFKVDRPPAQHSTGPGMYLVLTARDPDTGEVLSKCTYQDIDEGLVDGGIALVSHHGPESATSGHWFDDFTLEGSGVQKHPDRTFGPVICALHTLSEGSLKLTAQFLPLSSGDAMTAELRIDGQDYIPWATIDPDSYTATFHVTGWDARKDWPYRVRWVQHHGDGTSTAHEYEGMIRSEPDKGAVLKLAALTCHKTYTGGLRWNENGLWFPHADTSAAVAATDPDLLYFSGDQIYEGDLTPAWQENEDDYILDYLYKWSHWCWAFRDLARDRPCVTIPDDHDVYHGNLWGAGERNALKVDGLSAQDSGGYKHGPRFVNAVHRTQVGHLPDPVDPWPDAQGNSVYFTRLRYAGLDCAILADRQFKESPAIAVPQGDVYNGWFRAMGFDPATQADVPGAPLLGHRQEAFLEQWSRNWHDGDWMKLVLSQTPFACVQTLPDGSTGGNQPGLKIHAVGKKAPNDVPVADADSNGWPQSGRNRALAHIKAANALHICGDQHLGFVAQYGIDAHRDGTYVFCTPAIANTWPRRWMPAGRPLTGDHVDGFGNLVTIMAVSNPRQYGHEPAALHDRAPGWGLVRFDPDQRRVRLEAWPRWAAPGANDDDQYKGWPILLHGMGRDGTERSSFR